MHRAIKVFQLKNSLQKFDVQFFMRNINLDLIFSFFSDQLRPGLVPGKVATLVRDHELHHARSDVIEVVLYDVIAAVVAPLVEHSPVEHLF